MTITRRAIIIEAASMTGQPLLEGAIADARNLRSFLMSDIGGAWESGEVVTVSSPTKSALMAEIRRAASMDYVFITFSGHGYHAKEALLALDKVCLNDTDECTVNELVPASLWCTLLIDACRKVEIVKKAMRVVAFSESMKSLDPYYREACRMAFDQSIQGCERGTIKLFSCDLDEAAGEDKEGGFFTKGIIDESSDWADRQPKGFGMTLNIYDAFIMAKTAVQAQEPKQHPQFEGGRRLHYFPFAVKP
jgi:hypothetical protein